MVASKLSISLSPELAGALRVLAADRSEETSRLIETLLREHPLLRERIQAQRAERMLKKGRDVGSLLVLARQARRRWNERVRTGQVKIRGARR